jgi:mRNA-degrading endonuclease RelE of RelBE toxin-antitoxin system
VPLIVIPAAMEQLKAVPKADASRILEALEQVAADLSTRFSFVTEMVGQPGTWRLRKGDWRAVCTIEGNDVVVTRIGNRRGIYR